MSSGVTESLFGWGGGGKGEGPYLHLGGRGKRTASQ